MRNVVSKQGDTIDLICHRYFGVTGGVTEQVMAMNAHLIQYDLVLPGGVLITLPDSPKRTQKKIIQLWT